jgi:hypothetical protein
MVRALLYIELSVRNCAPKSQVATIAEGARRKSDKHHEQIQARNVKYKITEITKYSSRIGLKVSIKRATIAVAL